VLSSIESFKNFRLSLIERRRGNALSKQPFYNDDKFGRALLARNNLIKGGHCSQKAKLSELSEYWLRIGCSTEAFMLMNFRRSKARSTKLLLQNIPPVRRAKHIGVK
jgi:hypothetical protein